MKNRRKNEVKTVDVLREVEAMHRRAAAVDTTSLVDGMRWYAEARRRSRMERGAISVAACVAVFVVTLTALPERGYYYMIGDKAAEPQAVCEDINTIFSMG